MPVGAGLSSSAAIECAVVLAAAELSGLHLETAAMAWLAQRAENDFVGVPCGLMDQMASMACEAGAALLYPPRLERAEQAPVAAEESVPSLDGDRHEGESTRSATAPTPTAGSTCEDAAKILGVPSLRDISPADLDQVLEQDRGGHGAPRAACGDRDRPGRGRSRRSSAPASGSSWAELMSASHVSLRDDDEVSAVGSSTLRSTRRSAPVRSAPG